MVGSLPDLIKYAKLQVEIFRVYDFTGGRIFHFLMPVISEVQVNLLQLDDCSMCGPNLAKLGLRPLI